MISCRDCGNYDEIFNFELTDGIWWCPSCGQEGATNLVWEHNDQPVNVSAYPWQQAMQEALSEVRQSGEIECAHCGEIPDGVIAIQTDIHSRSHRICNKCAGEVLGWL